MTGLTFFALNIVFYLVLLLFFSDQKTP